MKLQKIECFSLWSEDPKKLAEWYKKIFDLQEAMSTNEPDDTGIGFDVNGTLLWIGYHNEIKGKSKEPFRFIIEFNVDDLSELHGRVKQHGGLMLREPSYSESVSEWVATVQDIDGNTIQFLSKEFKPKA